MNQPGEGWVAPGRGPEPDHAGPPPTYGGSQAYGGPPAYGGTSAYAWRPTPGVVPLRPLTVGELLDGAVGIIRRYPRPVLGLSAVLSLVVTALDIAFVLAVLGPGLSFAESGGSAGIRTSDSFYGLGSVSGLGALALSGLATVVLAGVLTAIAGRAVLGEPMTLAGAWAQVRPALWRLVVVAALTGVLVVGVLGLGVWAGLAVAAGQGTGAVAVPFILAAMVVAAYLYTRLSLAPCAVVLERASVRTSIRRSSLLVRRSLLRVFGVLLLATVVGFVVSQVVQLPLLGLGFEVGARGGQTLTDIATSTLVMVYIGKGITQTVVRPFTGGVRALLYVDRRMRAEALDVALTASVAARAS